MKCLTFTGTWYETQAAYNAWAQGKPLTKDVIVHTHTFDIGLGAGKDPAMLICVFFDETLHPEW